MLRACAHTALISYFHLQLAGDQIPSGVKTAQKLGWWKKGPDIHHSGKRQKQEYLHSLCFSAVHLHWILQRLFFSNFRVFLLWVSSAPPLLYSAPFPPLLWFWVKGKQFYSSCFLVLHSSSTVYSPSKFLMELWFIGAAAVLYCLY